VFGNLSEDIDTNIYLNRRHKFFSFFSLNGNLIMNNVAIFLRYLHASANTIACVVASFVIAACGGDGDSPFRSGTAYVSVEADPENIDVGDKTFVRVRIDDIKEEKFFLKVRFPPGLKYLERTSYIEIDGRDESRNPDKNFVGAEDGRNYIVYFLSKEELGDERDTTISFDLVGRGRVSSGKIEVDADLDDPSINNNEEVTAESPLFGAEAEAFIQVR